jgi:hypothetical protein
MTGKGEKSVTELCKTLQSMTPQESLDAWLMTIQMAKSVSGVSEKMFKIMQEEAKRRELEWIQHELVIITEDGCMIPTAKAYSLE